MSENDIVALTGNNNYLTLNACKPIQTISGATIILRSTIQREVRQKKNIRLCNKIDVPFLKNYSQNLETVFE